MTRGNALLAASSRAINPRRATACVALAAIAAIAGSQLVDYRAVEIGAGRYGAAAGVAPPQVGAATLRSAHGDWVLVLSGVALAILVAAAWLRRPALARFLVVLGGGVVAIAVALDRPHGLELGRVGLDYEGARAVLLGGYGAEIAAGATLAFAGFMLPLQPGAIRSRRPRARRSRARSSRRQPRAAPLEPRGAGG
jgi:hypothetical protein